MGASKTMTPSSCFTRVAFQAPGKNVIPGASSLPLASLKDRSHPGDLAPSPATLESISNQVDSSGTSSFKSRNWVDFHKTPFLSSTRFVGERTPLTVTQLSR